MLENLTLGLKANIEKEKKSIIERKREVIEKMHKDQELSHTKLEEHIYQNHPMKSVTKSWSICTKLGSFQGDSIQPIAKDLGVGPTLYLLTLKQLIKLFMTLSVLNAPVMWIYSHGLHWQGEVPFVSLTPGSIGN